MKAHYIVAESPQQFGASTEVLCGKILVNPEHVISIEVGVRGLSNFFNPIHDCVKCMNSIYEMAFPADKLYLYGVIEGEPKNAQADAA